MIIRIEYTCRQCGLERAAVNVLSRHQEDVRFWFEKVLVPTIAADHRARSPFCRATTISEIRVPISGAEKIGGAALN